MNPTDNAPAPAAPRLDERALRRPGWKGGRAIVLLDGQAWSFPTPTVRIGRVASGDGERSLMSRTHLAGLVDLGEAHAAGDVVRATLLELDMAAALLRQNYDLTDDQVDELIQFTVAAGELDEAQMTRAIRAHVRAGHPIPMDDLSIFAA